MIARRVVVFGLTLVGVVVVACWMVRYRNDLQWDEAQNMRTYSRHPLAAVALYREPNNHPLESLYKSLFHWGLGIDEKPFWKLPGFILVALWLHLTVAWFRYLDSIRAHLAAALMAILMLTAAAPFEQAMTMRGYFMTLLIGFYALLHCLKRTRLFEAPTENTARWHGRPRLYAALLLAAMLYCVPSNILLIFAYFPAFFLAHVASGAWRPTSPDRRIRESLLEILKFGLLTGAITAALYSPIFASLALGISKLHLIPTEGGSSAAGMAFTDFKILLEQCRPIGVDVTYFAFAVGALLLCGFVVALRGRHRMAYVIAAMLVLFTLVLPVLLALIVEYPARTKSPAAAPIIGGIVMLAAIVSQSWNVVVQRAFSMLAIGGVLLLAPTFLAATPIERESSDLTVVLATITRPQERRVLIGHDDLLPLVFPLHETFGPDNVMDGRVDMARTFDGVAPKPDYPEGSWRRRLRDTVFPKKPTRVFNIDDIDVLVLVDHLDRPRRVSPLAWQHPVLDQVKAVLSKHSTYRCGRFEIAVWER